MNFKKTQKIYDIYVKLSELETTELKNSSLYSLLVELLKQKVSDEEEYYVNLEYEEANRLFAMFESNPINPMWTRIYGYLIRNEGLYANRDSESVDDLEKLEEEIARRMNKLTEVCSKGVYLIYLSFLQEQIETVSDSELRKKLLSYKYYHALMEHDIESQLVDNEFCVPRVNYVNLYAVADNLKLPVIMSDEAILSCYLDTIITSIKQLLLISDDDYDNSDRVSISINIQCMLRAGLSLLSEKDYDQIRDEISDTINEMISDDNTISVKIVNSLIDLRQNDKCRVRKISLRPLEI